MKLHQGVSPDQFVPDTAAPRAVVTMGNFDGVHRGHLHLLARTVDRARALGAQSFVLTFDPHPAAVVAPERTPLALMPLTARVRALADVGVDTVWVLPFDERLAAMEPEVFVERVFVRAARARHLVLGPDARFGRQRRGDAQLLAELGAAQGFTLEQVAPLLHDGAPISSSRIRAAVAAGDVDVAAALLGRPHRVEGTVVRGDGRGRGLGFPTANVAVSPGLVRPASGVYRAAARVVGEHGGAIPAAVNVGERPTFAGASATVEAHLLGYEGDLYGRELQLELLEWLRPEQRFASVDALIDQVGRDLAHVVARGLEPPAAPR